MSDNQTKNKNTNSKGAILSSLNHEIRTQLNALVWFANALAKTDVSPEQAELLVTLDAVSDAFGDVADRLLGMKQIESGTMSLHRSKTDIHEIFEEVKVKFKPRCDENGVSFVVNIDEGVPKFIYEDGERLRQILKQVISDAVKCVDTGSIVVTALMRASDMLAIVIADTGAGIDLSGNDSLGKQTEARRKSPNFAVYASDMGMEISQGIVVAMGGGIEITRSPGVGSTVDIQFPLVAMPSDKRTDQAAANVSLEVPSQLKVLVAEDIFINQKVLDSYLLQWGLKADFVDDGEAAVKAANECEYDIIIMDIHMPKLDGVGAATEIRQKSELNKHTMIVALTADVFFQDSDESFIFDAIMNKPITPMRLLSVVQKAANKKGLVQVDALAS